METEAAFCHLLSRLRCQFHWFSLLLSPVLILALTTSRQLLQSAATVSQPVGMILPAVRSRLQTSLQWKTGLPAGSGACCELAIHHALRDATIIHASDVSEPARASLSQQSQHAQGSCLLQDCLSCQVMTIILLRQRIRKAPSLQSCLEYNVYVSLP